MVKVYPRPIDLENRDKLGRFAGVTAVDTPAELGETLARRRAELGL
jgi:flavoprotein